MGRPVRKPIEPDDQWRKYALCRFIDNAHELFFPTDRHKADVAARLCETCPVQHQCDAYASMNNVQFGIWGGVPRGQLSDHGTRPRWGRAIWRTKGVANL